MKSRVCRAQHLELNPLRKHAGLLDILEKSYLTKYQLLYYSHKEVLLIN